MKEKHHIKNSADKLKSNTFHFYVKQCIYLHGLVSNSYLILQPLLCINELSSLKFLYTTKNIILTYQTHKI